MQRFMRPQARVSREFSYERSRYGHKDVTETSGGETATYRRKRRM